MAPKKTPGKNNAKSQAKQSEDDHIVFTNKPDSKQKNKADAGSTPPAPRPDVKKVIGGASWTGKVPVQLLSEHCQREKWNKPEYLMRNVAGEDSERVYKSTVKLSKTDPKTRETTTIPVLELPHSHANISNQPTALEARHFAACYALFRVASMKNIHMALPPTYRDLWKGVFSDLKKEDVKEGRAWKYDADPFAADVKRKEIQAAMQKRQEEKAKQQASSEATAQVMPLGQPKHDKAFERASKVELGTALRTQLEAAVRTHSDWNISSTTMAEAEQVALMAELSAIGFRRSHVQEALQYCGSRDEVIDFLLIHIPEDDLPLWALPQNYNASIKLASGDVVREAKLRRLGEAGYSTELRVDALKDNDGSESLALEALQSSLVPPADRTSEFSTTEADADVWGEELMALESIMPDAFRREANDACTVALHDLAEHKVEVRFQRPSTGYPRSAVPVIAIRATSLPAYVRLSATRQVLEYAWKELIGDQMIFSIVEWITNALPRIIEEPGKLTDLEIKSSSFRIGEMKHDLRSPTRQGHISKTHRRPQRDRRSDGAIKDALNKLRAASAYQTMLSSRQKLPAWQKRDEILQAVASKQVTLITGDTGSGKSTQSVQFVLDDAIECLQGSRANILCTQPRRVAALALSDRVSSERCGEEGAEVGYIIRGQSKVSDATKITFMTTGVLLRRLQLSTNMQEALRGVSHVFVDEVHERSLDTDFLLALLKDALKQIPQLKVVLMSATVDADIFSVYFGGARNVAHAHIEGRTFPVQDLYLDDVLRLTNKVSQTSSDEGFDGLEIGKAIQALGGGLNFDLIASLVQEIDRQLGSNRGGILIFVPGTLEIDRCLRAISQVKDFHALPLHASLLPSEQKRVFPAAPKGLRKVVVATNVAETSITIDDIVAVIDTGRVKETSYDAVSNVVRLTEMWASQAACKQRKGRAGRVQAGTCYRLFTRTVEASMCLASEPEMNRVPLEQLCLSVKATAPKRDTATFLRGMLSPPNSSAVDNALHTLHRVGALDKDCLTGLGTYLSMIPADLRCAKLIVLGTIFGCLEACLTIAAILTVKSPFVSPRDKREEAKEARQAFPSADGDLLLDRTAFDEWSRRQSSVSYRELQRWCSDSFLSSPTLRDIESTRRQLVDALKETSLIPTSYSSVDAIARHPKLNSNDGNSQLLRALIAGSLNPNVAEIRLPDKKYIASMSGAKELDPEAKTIKYFGEPQQDANSNRLFVHPSSIMFDAQSFTGQASYMSYFTKMATSKTFIRELTPVNTYGLLLFGGHVEIDVGGRGITIDGWIKMRGWARIGVLVRRMRMLLDSELRRMIDEAGDDALDESLVKLVVKLVELNGHDQ